jgi:perosamine synthetase
MRAGMTTMMAEARGADSAPLPYGHQTISEEDIAAVAAVLRSDYLTQGPEVEVFEQRFADAVGARYAVAVNSATAALHLAMRVAGVTRGQRVVTSPITFLASANAAAYVVATPDFSDIDPVSVTLDPRALAAGWKDDTRAVVAVDYAGQASDLPALSEVARSRGAVLIDDACHAVGGAFHAPGHRGRPWKLGGNPWADATVFSFHPVKSMTTGEGGMLVTDRADWAEHARRLRSHGIVRDPSQGPWYYEMRELGYNYRLSDLQCALGLSQLRRLGGFLQRRREIVAAYNRAFAGLEWMQTPGLRNPADSAVTSWHLYTVRIDFARLGVTRAEAMAELLERGVRTQVLYIPVHFQPWYRENFGYAAGKCPAAEAFYEQALSLPLYPNLTESDVSRVVAAVRALA